MPVKQDIPAKVPVSQPVSEAKIFKAPVHVKPGKICCVVEKIGTLSELQPDASLTPGAPYQKSFQVPMKSDSNIGSAAEQIRYNNRKLTEVLDYLRPAIMDQGGGRRKEFIIKNYLQLFLDPYSEHIMVIDRFNASFSEVVRAVGGNEQQDIASVCFFLTIILHDDLKEESTTVTAGHVHVKTTIYTQKAVVNIRDFNGNVLKAFHVVGKTNRRQTSASKSEGFNPSSDLMEDVLKQIAEKVASYFVTKLEFKCDGPKGDEEFDADTVTFTVDGKEFENGNQICAGKHTVVAEAAGYKTVTKNITVRNNRSKTIIKLKFKKITNDLIVSENITFPTIQTKHKEVNK